MQKTVTIEDYLLRETVLSGIINGLFSIAFFYIFFAGMDPVPVWGMGSYAFDFLPQSFAIGLMASLVPGLLMKKALRAGSLPGSAPKPGKIIRDALFAAMITLVTGSLFCVILLWVSGIETISPPSALILKAIFGTILGAATTRIMLTRFLITDEGNPSD